MVNDFRTIITADNKPFIESIKKAERSFKNFRDGIGDQGGFKAFQSNIASAAGSITKLAGGLGDLPD